MLHINIKDLFLTFLLLCAFVMSLFLYYIFDVREHIATVFVFAVFLISLLTDGYLCGVTAAFLSTEAISTKNTASGDKIVENESIIDFTNSALTKFPIKISSKTWKRKTKASSDHIFMYSMTLSVSVITRKTSTKLPSH